MRSSLALCLVFVSTIVLSQPDSTKSKWYELQFSSEIGYQNNFNELNPNIPSSQLIYFGKENINLQLLAVNFIVLKNLGIQFSVKHILFYNQDFEEKFIDYLVAKYNDQYFVNHENDLYLTYRADYKTYNSLNYGLNYRIKLKNIELYPYVSYSKKVISFGDFNKKFKERNTNNYLEYNLAPTISNSEYNTLEYSTGLKLAYRVHENMLIYFKTEYSVFNFKVDYNEIANDLLSNTPEINLYKYDNKVESYNFGIGVILELSKLFKK